MRLPKEDFKVNSLQSFGIAQELCQNQCLKFRDQSRSFQCLCTVIQRYANSCTERDGSSAHPNKPGLNFRVFTETQPFTPKTCNAVPRAALRGEHAEIHLPTCRSRRVPAAGSPPSGCSRSAAPGRRGGGRRRGRAPRGGGARAGGDGAAGQLRPEPGSYGRQSSAGGGPTGVQVKRVRAGTAGPAGIPSARVCPSTRLGKRTGRSESREGCSGSWVLRNNLGSRWVGGLLLGVQPCHRESLRRATSAPGVMLLGLCSNA